MKITAEMSRRNESLDELLLKSPWPVSAIMGVLVFASLRWGLPAWWSGDNSLQPLAKLAASLAPLAALFFAVMACVSFCFGKKRKALVDRQTSLESLRKLAWKDFEYLVAEIYRREGYAVDFSLGNGPDGGVDLTLHKGGRTSLVQCKQWRTFSVGAPVVREQFGIMTTEHADEVIIVTSGKFTKDAEAFAHGKPIQLVNGPRLLELVSQVQGNGPFPNIRPPTVSQPGARPFCPTCGKEMTLKTARRGQSAGSKFWGCKNYPGCKGTRNA